MSFVIIISFVIVIRYYQKCHLLVFMINSKHVHFYWGVIYSLDPPMHIFGGVWTPPGIVTPGTHI